MSSKKIVVQLKVNHGGNFIHVIDSIFANTVKPDLVFLDLSSIEYPHRTMEVPWELVEYVAKNPRVKFMWDGNNPVTGDDGYEILDVGAGQMVENDFIERNITFKTHKYLDMTMISVFYDAGINELRKVATRKAVSHWIEQFHLPEEMLFIELGFNGVFTFSERDFPPGIQYIRMNGTDANKYLWQKENIWNIFAKKAKHEKLMFVDSDVAPMDDQDWFYKVYQTLDKCLFTQGFRTITYLKRDDTPTWTKKFSYTTTWINNGEVHPRNAVPAGVYCTTKHFLEMIGYFNAFSCGYADVLLWDEIIDHTFEHLWRNLFKRTNIKSVVQDMAKTSGKDILKEVFVDIFHFYHGEFSNRSYEQRNYMWMTQYPWMGRIVAFDSSGLLSWTDTNHYFFHVMSQFHTINDNMRTADQLMRGHVEYARFVREINERFKNDDNISMWDLVGLIRKYTIGK